MADGEGAVGHQLQLALVGVLVLGELGGFLVFSSGLILTSCGTAGHVLLILLFRVGLGDGLLETLVGLLEEGEVVVERLHVERAVDGNLTVVGDGVTQRRAVFLLTTTHPVIGCGVVGIGIQPVEDGQLVQRQLIRGRERLAVVQRTTEVLDASPYGVFPCRIAVGIEVFVDRLVAVGLLNLGLRARLEIHVQVLGEIPAQREVTVPQEL